MIGDENLILYLNLTGELFYIVAHRMKSQRVKVDLAKKVFNDLGLAICSPTRLHALMSGDISLVSMKFDQVRTMLDQIAHCSIMTVNQYSLEKLFELVMIATKYQYTMCQHPKDMLMIILNHLDNLRRVLTDFHAIRLAEDLHNVLVITYGRMSVATMKIYLDSIRNYVQEVRLKMTNLIKLGLQTATGEFVTNYPPDFWIHPECVKPGIIEVYRKGRFGGKSKKTVLTFDADNQSATHRLQHSLAFNGNRVTQLGNSVYDKDGPSITYDDQPLEDGSLEIQGLPPPSPDDFKRTAPSDEVPEPSSKPEKSNQTEPEPNDSDFLDVCQAVQGLDLCSQMLGCDTPAYKSAAAAGFSFKGFLDESILKSIEGLEDDSTTEGNIRDSASPVNVVSIDASGARKSGREATMAGLAAIAAQFDVEPSNEYEKTQDTGDNEDEFDMFSGT